MSKNSFKERQEQELKECLVSINRVSKTVKGGKNMSFSALVVVGDAAGKFGYGKGNATEVSSAKAKAYEKAKKNMIKISLKNGRTLHHDIIQRFCSAKISLRTAPPGTGLIAGGAMRAIFECAGVKDVVAKSIGTSNSYNLVAATFLALKNSESPKEIAFRRRKDVSEVIRNRNLILLGAKKNLSQDALSQE